MRRRNRGFWQGFESGDRVLVLLAASLSVSFCVGTRALRAQTLNGATVQLGRTSLNLPSGASVYIYGMGTGGAAPATNFAQGPYQQLLDAGGQVVAGLAITASNTNSFTTSCADFTVAGVSVSGFKTVSASYGANNQLHPTAASDTFPVTEAAVVVVVAIAGGEDHLELTGLPGLQIDAQKGPDQPHGIAIAIGHTNLQPGNYSVTETTEGDSGRDPAHEGDLIGVFVFTGGPGGTAGVSPLPSTGGGPAGAPSAPALPPYAFDGAFATYNLHWAQSSVPLTVTLSDLDPSRQTFKLTTKFGGALAAYSGEENGDLKNDMFMALTPASLGRLEEGSLLGTLPTGGETVSHSVSISAPAGRFVTEQVAGGRGAGAAWFDRKSGLLVRARGGYFLGLIVGPLAGLPGAELELVKTNIPMDRASPWTSPYVITFVLVLVLAVIITVVLVRTGRRKPQPAPYTAAGPVPVRAVGATGDVINKLTKLKALLDSGVITREDFESEKGKLLSQK